MDHYDVIVVGGGVCGLTAAQHLLQRGKSVLIVDKAKRLGGRVASGKIGHQLLDVGALCTGTNLSAVQHLGMGPATPSSEVNSSAADLCNLWSKQFTWRQGFVTTLKPHGSLISVVTEFSGATVVGSNVILTCPPEQSAHLLTLSGLTPPVALKEITHTKEIVLLVETQATHDRVVVVQNGEPSSLLSLHQQRTDDATGLISLALRASASWSEAAWTADAQNVRATLLKEFAQMFPGLSVVRSETKRWRYANARETSPTPFAHGDRSSTIFCAGDGFGESTLSGLRRAAASGLAIANHLAG